MSYITNENPYMKGRKKMFAKELKAFKERHNIRSADEWSTTTGVSKSTIRRGLKGDGKDVGVNTLLDLISPYGETLDQLLQHGEYSPDKIMKNELAEKIENVIDELENSEMISEDPAEEIKNTLIEAQQYINNKHSNEECPACRVLREMIAVLNEDKDAKNKWIINSFKLSLILLIILFSMIVIDGVLIFNLINILT